MSRTAAQELLASAESGAAISFLAWLLLRPKVAKLHKRTIEKACRCYQLSEENIHWFVCEPLKKNSPKATSATSQRQYPFADSITTSSPDAEQAAGNTPWSPLGPIGLDDLLLG